MIKATELRIGNWVLIRDNLLCVKGISKKVSLGNTPDSEFVHDEFDCSVIKPVPLTPEMLERCGFERVYSSLVFGDYYLYDAPDFEGNWWFKNLEHNFKVVKIKYLHQLQNLYFALTGEELVMSKS